MWYECDFCWHYWGLLPAFIMWRNVEFPLEVSENRDRKCVHLEPLPYSRDWQTMLCHLFSYRLPAKNVFYFLNSRKKNEKRILCDTGKLYEMQILISTSKVWLEYGQRSLHTAAAELSRCDRDSMWPEKPKIFTLWPFRGKFCCPLLWRVHEPGISG